MAYCNGSSLFLGIALVSWAWHPDKCLTCVTSFGPHNEVCSIGIFQKDHILVQLSILEKGGKARDLDEENDEKESHR